MNDNIEKLCSKSMDLLESNLNTVLTNLPGENVELKEEFNKVYAEYCRIDLELSAHRQAIDHVKTLQTDCENTIKEEYKNKYADISSDLPSPKNHPRYKTFSSKLKDLVCKSLEFEETNEEECDTTNSRLDPFTKKPIQIAVKNKRCGHLYDNDSINQMLQMHSRLQCPVVGCRNKQKFTLNDLEICTEDLGTEAIDL